MRSVRELLPWIANRAGALTIVIAMVGAIVWLLVLWSPQPNSDQAAADIWTCSMHPQVRLDKPGRCPICGMSLIPLSQLKAEQERVIERTGLVTETITSRELWKEIRTVGKLDYNERRVAYITARIDGRVDRIYADVVGTKIKANDHLVDIYSPTLNVTQKELQRALEAYERNPDDQFNKVGLESARERLRLFGLLSEQIADIEKRRSDPTLLTIYAPIGGIVVEKNVREQQYVARGDTLYRIAELDPIWLYLDIYEYDLAWVRYGQPVDVTAEAYPSEIFHGTIVFIDPFLNDETRTVKVRVNLKNPDFRLKPAMYASATIHVSLQSDGTTQPTGLEGKYVCPMHPEVVRNEPGRCPICQMALERVPDVYFASPVANDQAGRADTEPSGQALAIPKSAVLDTGRRKVAYRKRKDGSYEIVELKLGPLAESKDGHGNAVPYYPVLAGVSAGDEVVAQGGFLLDSQRQIEGMPSLLYSEGRSAASLHAGHGGSTAPTSTPATKPAEHKH